MTDRTSTWKLGLGLILVLALVALPLAAADHTTGVFSGAKVNKGTATHTMRGSDNVLTLSDDFVVPDTPDPHWQVVDSKGKVHLLQRIELKDGKMNHSIVVPSYVPDIAKVQIWCAWAEVVLGEASFAKPVG
jgi:hypothetical protein